MHVMNAHRIYDGRPFVAALLFLAGRLDDLPEWQKARVGLIRVAIDGGS